MCKRCGHARTERASAWSKAAQAFNTEHACASPIVLLSSASVARGARARRVVFELLLPPSGGSKFAESLTMRAVHFTHTCKQMTAPATSSLLDLHPLPRRCSCRLDSPSAVHPQPDHVRGEYAVQAVLETCVPWDQRAGLACTEVRACGQAQILAFTGRLTMERVQLIQRTACAATAGSGSAASEARAMDT